MRERRVSSESRLLILRLAVRAIRWRAAASAAVFVVAVVAWVTGRTALRSSGWGVLAGVGAISLLVAFVQRRGPGTFCYHTATKSGCGQYLDPWPWLVAGVLFVVLSAALQVRAIRRSGRPAPSPR